MDYFFDEWKKTLEEFRSSVSKDLDEIRKHKEEIRQVKAEICSAKNAGYFLRDDHRIVISAPEIIIGDVDRDGTLNKGGQAHVILRGRQVDLDGVGKAGSVRTRAASIRQTAADPGIDGQEAVVGPISEVVNQAGSIVLEGNATKGVFSRNPQPAGDGGIRIHADGDLTVEASVSSQRQKDVLEGRLKSLESLKSQAEDEVESGIKAFDDIASSIKNVCDYEDSALSDVMDVRANVSYLAEIEEKMSGMSEALYRSYESCARALSRLAEINRQITCLKNEESALKTGDDYKKKLTGASVSIVGERVDIISRDGDGNLRDNDGAGLGILANDIRIEAVDGKGALQKDGRMSINARTVELSTLSAGDLKYDDKNQLESAAYTAQGDVFVRSKNISFESVDKELKDKKLQEKTLAGEGSFKVRAEKIDLSATDTEGKATGSMALNAREVAIRSVDVEKEKRTDNALAAGSSMVLVSEKMFIGSKSDDIKSKMVQAVSQEIGLFADKTLEAQQEKAVLQLSGGKTAISGSENEVYGKTVINAAAEVKAEVKAPKATVDHVEAKTSFKSQNISDGIPVPPPPATASFSAKLKAQDAPKSE